MAAITVPIIRGGSVVVFPDELPLDSNDLTDVLKGELAPLAVWKTTALEYEKQGFEGIFDVILKEILEQLENKGCPPEVYQRYTSSASFQEDMANLYHALAAKALQSLIRLNRTSGNKERKQEVSIQIREYLKKATQHDNKSHFFSLLIQGFFELYSGATSQAEPNLQMVTNIAFAPNSQHSSLRFGAKLATAMLRYETGQVEEASRLLGEAMRLNPSSPSAAELRVAYATCCFRLNQHPEARAALDNALSIDPGNSNCLVLLALLDQEAARKNPQKRRELRSSASDYALLAASMDESNPSALHLAANHHFHTWKPTQNRCLVLGPDLLVASRSDFREKQPNEVSDLLRVSGNDAPSPPMAFSLLETLDSPSLPSTLPLSVSEISEQLEASPETLILIRLTLPTLSPTQPSLVPLSVTSLQIRELSVSESLARRAIEVQPIPFILNSTLSLNIQLTPPSLASLRAECFYLLGKIHQVLENLDGAMKFYQQSLNEKRDFSLSMFEMGRIVLSRQDIPRSLDIFKELHIKNKQDRDSEAFYFLTSVLQRLSNHDPASPNAPIPLPVPDPNKLREVATGFDFEADLWLMHALEKQRHKPQAAIGSGQRALVTVPPSPQDLSTALTYYQQALISVGETLTGETSLKDSDSLAFSSAVYSNISVILHAMGRSKEALARLRSVFVSLKARMKTSEGGSCPFKCPDLEGVLYDWRELPGILGVRMLGVEEALSEANPVPSSPSSMDLAQPELTPIRRIFRYTHEFSLCSSSPLSLHSLHPELRRGGSLMIQDTIHTIQRTEGREGPEGTEIILYTSTPIPLIFPPIPLSESSPRAQMDFSTLLPVLCRQSFPLSINQDHSLLTCLFNLGRVLEGGGKSQAAIEVYLYLTNRFPEFIECYLRLGLIAREMGDEEEGRKWVSRAQAVDSALKENEKDKPNRDSENVDLSISRGDALFKPNSLDEARKVYEKILSKRNQEPRAHISLGTLHLCAHMAHPLPPQTESEALKSSYKFFHSALSFDPSSIYAAVGLGLVCAEKEIWSTAKEALSRAKDQSSVGSISHFDMVGNLALVSLHQSRPSEADSLLSSHLRSAMRLSRVSGVGMNSGLAAGDTSSPNSGSGYWANLATSLLEGLALAQFRGKKFEDCLRSLQQAAHLNPSSLRYLFNLALARQTRVNSLQAAMTAGTGVAGSAGKKRTSEEVKAALKELGRAHGIWKFLLESSRSHSSSSSSSTSTSSSSPSSSSSSSSPYPKYYCGMEMKIVLSKLTGCTRYESVFRGMLEDVLREEEVRRAEKEKQEQVMRLRQEQLAQQREAEAKAKEEKLRLETEAAKAAEARLAEMQDRWAQAGAPESSKGRKAKNKEDQFIRDDEGLDQEGGAGGGGGGDSEGSVAAAFTDSDMSDKEGGKKKKEDKKQKEHGKDKDKKKRSKKDKGDKTERREKRKRAEEARAREESERRALDSDSDNDFFHEQPSSSRKVVRAVTDENSGDEVWGETEPASAPNAPTSNQNMFGSDDESEGPLEQTQPSNNPPESHSFETDIFGEDDEDD